MTLNFKISWFFIALLFGWIINELNLYYVKKENLQNVTINNKSTVYGYTIWNADAGGYTYPIKSLLEGKGYSNLV